MSTFATYLAARLDKPEGFQIDVPRCHEHEVRALLRSREGTPLAHTYTYGGSGLPETLVLQVYKREG